MQSCWICIVSIVCSCRKTKRDLYVVKPEWITDSVKEGKRLNETTYSLIRAQSGIDSIFCSLV